MHRNRIRIVEELRNGEHSVNSLRALLGVSHAGVSQHLALLRSHRVVQVRRDGRLMMYRLRQPEFAAWLVEAFRFLVEDSHSANQRRTAIEQARIEWAQDQPTN